MHRNSAHGITQTNIICVSLVYFFSFTHMLLFGPILRKSTSCMRAVREILSALCIEVHSEMLTYSFRWGLGCQAILTSHQRRFCIINSKFFSLLLQTWFDVFMCTYFGKCDVWRLDSRKHLTEILLENGTTCVCHFLVCVAVFAARMHSAGLAVVDCVFNFLSFAFTWCAVNYIFI